jgi:hypothetical protein
MLDFSFPSSLASVGRNPGPYFQVEPRFQADAEHQRYLWGSDTEPTAETAFRTVRRKINTPQNAEPVFDPTYQPMEPLAGPPSAQQWSFTRISPQLVRDPGSLNPDRAQEDPGRNRWSMKWSQHDAASGTVRWDDVYAPEFDGYVGGLYRGLGDVNLGQEQYYVSDTDPFRDPNYAHAASVRKFDFKDPMGRILPEYSRWGLENTSLSTDPGSLKDVEAETGFREDLMASQSQPQFSREWKFRAAPGF